MEALLIKKSVDINAPKEEVWKTLILQERNAVWYNEFSKGTIAETDWETGSKVIFKDPSQSGIIGFIKENKPYEVLIVEYTGMLMNGEEDYDGEMAQAFKGVQESYWLTEQNGQTRLDVETYMGEDYYEMMSKSWDNAMEKIKELSEGKTA